MKNDQGIATPLTQLTKDSVDFINQIIIVSHRQNSYYCKNSDDNKICSCIFSEMSRIISARIVSEQSKIKSNDISTTEDE